MEEKAILLHQLDEQNIMAQLLGVQTPAISNI